MAGFAAVIPEGGLLASIGAFTDAFTLLRHQVGQIYHSRESFNMQTALSLLSLNGRPVQLANGKSLNVDAGLNPDAQYTIIYLPAFFSGSATNLITRLYQAQPLYPWLRRQYEQGTQIAASGSSVLMLAEAGLLQGVTVSIGRPFKTFCGQRYPGIKISPAPVSHFERIFTSSGLASDFQMVSGIIEATSGPELNRWLGYVTGWHRHSENAPPEDSLIANAQIWLEERFAENISISTLADAMSVSQQTLLRHFRRHLNMTPQTYLRHLRVENAKRLLSNTSRTVEQIASLVGYNDVQSFRKVFREFTGASASQYRRQSKNSIHANPTTATTPLLDVITPDHDR
jgi:transcriptional regulator GlxA family with amidase domain